MKPSTPPISRRRVKKPSPYPLPSPAKFFFWLVLPTILVTLALSLFFIRHQEGLLYRQKVKEGKVLLDHLALTAALPLLGDDQVTLSTLVKEPQQVDAFLYAMILDRSNGVKAYTDPAKIGVPLKELEKAEKAELEKNITSSTFTLPAGVRVLNLAMPVSFRNQVVGSVYVGLSLDEISREVQKEKFSLGSPIPYFLLLAVSLVMGAGFYFYRGLSRRISALSRGRSPWLKRIEDSGAGKRDSVSPEIQRRLVTVLFAGIKGFRIYADTKGAREVLIDLNEYRTIARNTILEYGGHVDRLIGDAVIGVFGNSPLQADHTAKAVKSAIAMQKALEEAGKRGNQLLSQVGIGLSSGVVLSGPVGSPEKKEYTFIGESFRGAYTLNVLAGPGEILVSKEIYESIAGIFPAEPLAPREMVQRTEPWENFRLTMTAERKNGG